MTGRVILVTGANSGIGYEVSRYLCEGGYDVVLACRDVTRGQQAVERIKEGNPYALATFLQLDLASKKSIESFVDQFHKTGKKLHVLICNAGMMTFGGQNRGTTEDGLEVTMGTNYFGHFYLTSLLLDDLRQTGTVNGDSRIILVTSRTHNPDLIRKRNLVLAPLDPNNLLLHREGTYSHLQAYKNSKLALIMFGYELARKLEGTNVTINSICPGVTPSSNFNRNASLPQRVFMKWFVHRALRFMHLSRSIHESAASIINLTTNDDLAGVTGKYYLEEEMGESSAESYSVDNQKRLWELTGGMLQMKGFEPVEIPVPVPSRKNSDFGVQVSPEDLDGVAASSGNKPTSDSAVATETVEMVDSQTQHEEDGASHENMDSMMVEPGDQSNLEMTLDESKQIILEDSMLDDSALN